MEKRKNREDMARLPGGSIFGTWKTIMAPKTDPEVKNAPSKFNDRPSGAGQRLASNPFPKTGGVYEMRVVPPGGTNKDAVVIYLGKAGGDGTKSSLSQRMGQYMRNGSHKKEMYDAFLRGGCKIQVRVATEGPTTRSTTGADKVKGVESHFLNKADYAANKMENGKNRFYEVTMKVNGKNVTMDKFLDQNGYTKDKARTKKTPIEKILEQHDVSKAASTARTKKTARPVAPRSATKDDARSSTVEKLRKDGKPDRRYRVNRIASTWEGPSSRPKPTSSTSRSSPKMFSSGLSKYGMSRLGSYEGYIVPLTNSEMPDMRFSVNKDLFG